MTRQRPLPNLRFKALETAKPIDVEALERVAADRRADRQPRDTPKRRADRAPGELAALKVYVPAPMREALDVEALKAKSSLSDLVTKILEAHFASGPRGPEAQRPAAPTLSYRRPEPR